MGLCGDGSPRPPCHAHHSSSSVRYCDSGTAERSGSLRTWRRALQRRRQRRLLECKVLQLLGLEVNERDEGFHGVAETSPTATHQEVDTAAQVAPEVMVPAEENLPADIAEPHCLAVPHEDVSTHHEALFSDSDIGTCASEPKELDAAADVEPVSAIPIGGHLTQYCKDQLEVCKRNYYTIADKLRELRTAMEYPPGAATLDPLDGLVVSPLADVRPLLEKELAHSNGGTPYTFTTTFIVCARIERLSTAKPCAYYPTGIPRCKLADNTATAWFHLDLDDTTVDESTIGRTFFARTRVRVLPDGYRIAECLMLASAPQLLTEHQQSKRSSSSSETVSEKICCFFPTTQPKLGNNAQFGADVELVSRPSRQGGGWGSGGV